MPLLPLAFLLLWPPQTTPPPATPLFDPHAAVQQALHRLDESDSDHTRFTYMEREHILTYAPDGPKVYDDARTYEITWIDSHPYFRLVKLQDQPLTAKEEKNEQKLYDQAVAKRKDLGAERRNALAGLETAKPDVDIHAILTPAYTLTEISQQPTANGDLEHLVEARLAPKAARKSVCPWRFQLWISEKDPMLTHYEADVPGDKTPACQDARDIVSYTLVDGLPKLSRLSIRFYPYAPVRSTSVADYIYTNYRRFNTTVTMHTGSVIDETPTPAPPQ